MKTKIIITSIILILGISFISLLYGLYALDRQIKDLEKEKTIIQNKKSEIEIIKEAFNKNKELIKRSSETIENTKKIYEKAVWLDRCLSNKLLDEKEDCNNNLERFKTEQGL